MTRESWKIEIGALLMTRCGWNAKESSSYAESLAETYYDDKEFWSDDEPWDPESALYEDMSYWEA